MNISTRPPDVTRARVLGRAEALDSSANRVKLREESALVGADSVDQSFSDVQVSEKRLRGWDLAKDVALSPIPAMVVGAGLLTGFLSAAMLQAGPQATAWLCAAGVGVTTGLSFVAAVGEGAIGP